MNDREMKSPENLYLVGALVLFLILPFQNCSINPIEMMKGEAGQVQLPEGSKSPVYSVQTTSQ